MTSLGLSPLSPEWPADAIEVGRVMDAWGLKGGFKVQPYSSDPQALFSSRRWFLKPPAPDPKRPLPTKVGVNVRVGSSSGAVGPVVPDLLRVTSAREQGDLVVATAQEIPDRNAAEALRGARVFVSRLSFPTAESNEFYWIDLIGLDVVNREGVALGRVVGLLETGPHCVLRVHPPRVAADGGSVPPAEETLIPFVDAYVDRVDLKERSIVVDWGADY